MWTTFKEMPLLPKIVILCLVLGIVVKVGSMATESGSNAHRYVPVGDNNGGYRTASRDEGGAENDGGNRSSQALAQYQAQQQQLMARVQQCEGEMTAATNRQAMAAMNGQMYNQRPACEAYMPQWISQEAFLETQIARIQDPNDHRSLREITGIAPPSYSNGSGSTGGGSYNNPDGGLASVENYDREGVRGNSIYTDESGEQHELPTANYYFRDRSSGQIVSSSQATPPNDGRDYEQFSYQSQPQ